MHFGRKKLKGTDIDNPNYNLKKLNAMKKNLAEYKILKTYLADNFDDYYSIWIIL